MVNRRLIRESVMQLLYAHDLSKESPQKIAGDVFAAEITGDESGKVFAFKLTDSVLANEAALNERIRKHTDNWELDRMAAIDKIVMRMALAEILFFEDIPPKVSINEAIEIAKKYSTDKSGKFVNGILDAAYIALKAEGQLKKAGRGLIDSSSPKPVVTKPAAAKKATPQDAAKPSPKTPPSPKANGSKSVTPKPFKKRTGDINK
jgi:N utilization substance protein B